MAILTHKCPHCLTEHIALRLVAVTVSADGATPIIYLTCPKCKFPSTAHLVAKQPGHLAINQLMGAEGDIADFKWTIKQFWPSPPGPVIPDLLPPEVERVYLQAERNFSIAGNEEAAGTMYRKALDIGLKTIDPAITGTLKGRIAKLVSQAKLTPSLGEWANQIRLLGNETAHEIDQPTRDELEALRNFSDLVMRYLFTLPKMVDARKALSAAPQT
jgi:hypothetical protein